MTDRHLDEGIIQAYIDGELSREHAAATAAHLGACEACAAALAEAEGESSFFATAFAPDDSVSVPTAALRARLNTAVAQLEASTKSEQRHSQGLSFGALFAPLKGLFNFTPRTAVAFATLLIAVVAGIIYISSRKSQQPIPMPLLAETGNPAPAPSPVVTTTPEDKEPQPVATPDKGDKGPAYVLAAHKKSSVKRRPVAPSGNVKDETLPGEQEYQTAIASLEKTIKLGGEESLRPALRADYERNLALIDSAITQTRQVAAQNPKDKDAVSFLMSVYQSKVELLSRVADQAQTAALGR